MGYTSTQLQSVCEVTSSKRIYANELCSTGVPFYRSKEIIEKLNGEKEHSNPLYISEDRYQEIIGKNGAIEEGDLLLTSRGTLGVPYIVKKNDRFHFADGNLTWFRNFNGLNSRYLKYFLLSPLGKAELSRCVIGSSQAAYTIASLKEIKIPLPDVTYQSKVVSVLSAYDDLIENNTRRITILEKMAQSLYREWFIKFRFPGHENTKFIDSPLGKIPEGWDVKKLSEVINIDRGRSYKSSELVEEGGYAFLNLKNVAREGGFRRDGLKRYDGPFKPNQTAKPNDIIMAVTDMTQERAIIARPARVPNMGIDEFVFSMDLIKITVKEGYKESFIYSLLRYSDFPHVVKQFANGANVLHLSPKVIEDYEALVPSENIRSLFVDVVSPIHEIQDALEKKNDNLKNQRNMLLPKLISGSITILVE